MFVKGKQSSWIEAEEKFESESTANSRKDDNIDSWIWGIGIVVSLFGFVVLHGVI